LKIFEEALPLGDVFGFGIEPFCMKDWCLVFEAEISRRELLLERVLRLP
jgi:hypothetical protein